jgi:hypothetical protein
LRVTDSWSASGSGLWKFEDIMTIRGQALYAGIRLEAGQAYRLQEGLAPPEFEDDETIYGFSFCT